MKNILKHIISLFSLLLICSSFCSSQTKTFKECITDIPLLQYPIKYGCGGHELMQFMSADSFWQKSYSLENGLYHAGRLFPERKFITLFVQALDQNSPPAIFTYNDNGKLIDSLIVAKSCYEVPSGLFYFESTIKKDGTVIEVDKINFFPQYENEEVVFDSTKTTIKTLTYSLQVTGKFVLSKIIEKKGK